MEVKLGNEAIEELGGIENAKELLSAIQNMGLEKFKKYITVYSELGLDKDIFFKKFTEYLKFSKEGEEGTPSVFLFQKYLINN
jgi:hypothetical protein